MSDTKRTDDMVFDANCNTQDAPLWVVPAHYARQLQRELKQVQIALTEQNRQVVKYNECIAQLRKQLAQVRESRAEWRRLAESKIRQLAQAQADLGC